MQSSSLSSQNNVFVNGAGDFGGLIKQSYFKKLKNHLFELFIYLDSIVPSFAPMHELISIWRIVQFIGPCFCAANKLLWNFNKTEGKAISIISIFYHIVPVEYRKSSASAIELIYSVIHILFFILIIGSVKYYKKKAALPKYLTTFIYVFISTFGYLLHPIVLNYIGEDIGRLIKKESFEVNLIIAIVSLVLSLICLIIWCFFFTQIAINSFLFRPNSLISVLSLPQILFCTVTYITTLIIAIASQLDKLPSAILIFISAVVYCFGIMSVFVPGTFIWTKHQCMIVSGSITSCIVCLIMGIYIFVGQKPTFIEIFVVFIILIIFYIISFFVHKLLLINQMKIINDYQDNNITINDIKNPDELIKLEIISIQNTHPSSLNWHIFRDGCEKWPENVKIWVVFGKFVAIYPNENDLLYQIIYSINMYKLKGNLAKQTIAQAKKIYTQRESSLSTSLKGKLNKCSKNVQVTKRKLRHVWDLAIQGSIKEMEASINTAFQSVNHTNSNFNHLISEYPNNRFVARHYLRYILEIEKDSQKIDEWTEKVSFLHRGISINSDKANILGIDAFPNLPPLISDSYTKQTLMESESFTSESENLIDDSNQNKESISNDQIQMIKDHIDNLRISATTCIKMWNIFLFFLLIFFPSILIMAFFPKYMNDLSQSLYYIYHLSYLRALVIQTPIFSNHYLNEEMGFISKPLVNMAPESYGFEHKTDLMLQFLLKEMSNQIENLNEYRLYQKNNKLVKPVHDIVFSGNIPYIYYSNQYDQTKLSSTLQGVLTDIIMSATTFIETIHKVNCSQNVNQCWDLKNTSLYLNQYWNYLTVANDISEALNLMNEYLSKNVNDAKNLSFFLCVFLCILYTIVIIGILFYELQSLGDCKKSIYNCLIALPKNVVSSISESLKMINSKGDDGTEKVEQIDSDLNKQDENILKIFSASGDASSMKSHDKTVLIVCSVLMLGCALACTCILAFSFPQIAEQLNHNAPHLDYIFGATAYGFEAIGALNNLILISNCHGIFDSIQFNCEDPHSDRTSIDILFNQSDFILSALKNFTKYYNSARYGDENNNVPPYSLFEHAIENANSITEGCENNNDSLFQQCPEFFSCYDSNIQVYIFGPIVASIAISIGEGSAIKYNATNPILNQLWNLMTIGLCNKLFFPMFDKIIPEMEKNLSKVLPPAETGVIFILILGFFNLTVIIILILSSEAKMRFTLNLLTQCPPNIVIQNSKIMNILSSNFVKKEKDTSVYNSEYFDLIVQCIPDSVIICNENFKVSRLNKATERIYGVEKNDFLNINVREFFTNNQNIKGNVNELFETNTSNVNIEYTKNNSDDKSFLDVTLNFIAGNYVILTQDNTQTVLYNTLVSEERTKSDRLLSSILPPNLVKRVQDGEKNISFSVQSASILFLDIVEFTPWCASNTASMVMSTLNYLFKRFDELLETHATMTKIKCIGDCYMCAGGIFVEINQASVHAKETVEFGLEVIQAIEENNNEKNLSLRIRVGVNTGGPIVAGVLGTDKPTFEILGPAINMAQQMENHGVPMKVHISRTTYELVYGGSFVITERGQIEIKKGSVLTYLVETKK